MDTWWSNGPLYKYGTAQCAADFAVSSEGHRPVVDHCPEQEYYGLHYLSVILLGIG